MRIVIGAPGNGALLKDELKSMLEADERVSKVTDLSTAEITYPDVSFQVAEAVRDGEADRASSSAVPVSAPRSPQARSQEYARRRPTTS